MSENIRPLESDSLEVQRSTLFTPSFEVLAIGGVNLRKKFSCNQIPKYKFGI